jgi:hypothetical protein
MKSGFFGAVALLLAAASWAAAQSPAPIAPPADAPGATTYPTFTGPCDTPAPAPAGPAGGPVWYANADFLLWHIRGSNIPSGFSVAPVGLISTPVNNVIVGPGGGTTVVPSGETRIRPVNITNSINFGTGNRADYGDSLGGRFALGFWCDPEMTWGLEATGFFLDRGVDHFSAVQGGTPNDFTLNLGRANRFLVSAGTLTPSGSIPLVVPRASVTNETGNTSTNLYDGELNIRCVGLRFGCVDFGGLLGFRYLSVLEHLNLSNNSSIFLPPGFSDPIGTSLSENLAFNTLDNIRTLNTFYGGQIGMDIDARFGSFFINVRGKLGLGDMHQQAETSGITSVNNLDPAHPAPPSSVMPGGLLSSPADAGQSFSRDHIAFIPELNLKVGYQVCAWLRAYVGYDILDINSVARAGGVTTTNTINSTITIGGVTNVANIAQPTFRFQDQHILVQGFNFGVELTY